MKQALVVVGCMLLLSAVKAQTPLKQKNWECHIAPNGTLKEIIFRTKTGNDTIPFFKKENKAGPCFYLKSEDKEQKGQWTACGKYTFNCILEGVECVLRYKEHRGWPAIEVTLTNRAVVPFQPQKAGLKLGIDTYMDHYPEWFHKYFPTLMRCEKTHFYGYLQTPEEHTLAVVSEQPIASWSVDYNLGYMDPAPHWFMGHRIESLNLDLLNELPLPDRHPEELYQLLPGESRTWLIALVNTGELENLENSIRGMSGIPMIDISRTACRPGETAQAEIRGKHPQVEVWNDKGEMIASTMKRASGADCWRVDATLPEVGLYTLKVKEGDYQAEAMWSAVPDWRWTMERARENALRYHQKATSHIESWYGFYSAFLAARYFPDEKLDEKLDQKFEYLFNLLHDTSKMVPKYHASRIQNTAGTIGLLTHKYKAGGDIHALIRARRLADWLIQSSQREDGAYCNHRTIYTSVIYIAKSILELAQIEKELGQKDPEWLVAYQRHYDSAKKAVDQLVASKGNFQTEGEMTFEDGMISCSALQIGMFALLQDDPEVRQHYTEAMLEILNSHSCLTQLKVPDARRRQGTMRYWEAQYDVQMLPNMFNSPHGWSAWRTYATYYAYLLTGERKWLEQTFNAMGAFANLIDYKTGDLRWAFVVDPHLQVEQACSADKNYQFTDLSFGNPHPRLYNTRKFVIGEQYVNMVSDWQTVNTQDNDVHEVFKCMGETVLTHAFLVAVPEDKGGGVEGYNCMVRKRKDGIWEVEPAEKQISHVHYNLKQKTEIIWKGRKKVLEGTGWL